MDIIYITNNLHKFKTKYIPLNCLIYNLPKYYSTKDIDNLKNIIENLKIKKIICENKNVKKNVDKFFSKYNTILVEKCDEITLAKYKNKTIIDNLYNVLLAVFITFCVFFVYQYESKWLIFWVLMFEVVVWLMVSRDDYWGSNRQIGMEMR